MSLDEEFTQEPGSAAPRYRGFYFRIDGDNVLGWSGIYADSFGNRGATRTQRTEEEAEQAMQICIDALIECEAQSVAAGGGGM
jgi:hypothetical protein